MRRSLACLLIVLLAAPAWGQAPVRIIQSDHATETQQAAILAAIDQLEGYLDGVEGVLGTIDADTSAGAAALYTEDDAAAANPTGIMPVMVRADSASTVADTNGDVVAQRITNYGAAFVSLRAAHNGSPAYIESTIPNGGGGEAALYVSPKSNQTDDGAFSVATDAVDGIAALADETSPDSVNEGDAGIVRMTLDRKLLTRVVGATDGNRLDVDASGHAQVDIAAASVTVPVDGSGVTQPVSAASLPLPTGAATAANQTTIAGHVDGIEGLLGTIDADTGSLAGTVSGSAVQTKTTGIDPLTASGSITGATQSVSLDVTGYGALGIQIAGTWTGTLGFDATIDNTNWQDLQVSPANATSYTTATASNGIFYVQAGGLKAVRVFSDSFSSGTADISLRAAPSDGKTPSAFGQIAPADNTSNPAVAGVAVAMMMCFDGSTWDRCPGDSTNGLTVNLGSNNDVNIAEVGGVAAQAAFLDPCQREAKIRVSISTTSSAQLITGTASERIYICSLHLVTATAQNIALVSGTGTTCGTSTSGVEGFGGATAATGWNFAANGGIALAASGFSYGNTDTDQDNVCLLLSGSGQVSGGLTYVSAASGL